MHANATLNSRDLVRVLDVIRMMNGAAEGAFLRTMLTGTAGLIASDTVSYNEHDTANVQEERYLIEPDYAARTRIDPAYHRHLGQHPVFEAISDGRLTPGRSVAVSDLMSGRDFHQLPLYREYFREREVEDQLAVLVGAGRTRSRLMVFSRSRRGFAARDRAAVETLVPHLRQALRHRARIAQLSGAVALRREEDLPASVLAALTARELEVMNCLITGATDHTIGRTLGVSPRTVGKHLENIYRKVGVSGRAALLAALGGIVSSGRTVYGTVG